MSFKSTVIATHQSTRARVMDIETPHGHFLTPVFMPVGTRAGVNNMMPSELIDARSQIILGGNTYHMLVAPGMDVIQKAGGMHPFMGWHGPMLTDSGGFQVFSLSKNKEICTIDEIGAHFKSPRTNEWIHMTPEMSIMTQKTIGADIIMAFDQCTSDQCSKDEVAAIMARTHRWLLQSLEAHQNHPTSVYGHHQALFGIIQGGLFQDLRQACAEFVTSLPLDGIAIGGETIGFDMASTVQVIQSLHPQLPEDKPRYTMGLGMSPQDLLDVVCEGIDMFDCVAPTRNARHGALYSGELVPDGHWLKFSSPFEQERLQIKKACFATDHAPLMATCDCYTCQNYSRSMLHHLFKQKAELFTALASIHNIHVMNTVCDTMRDLIFKESL
jgi:queuine tRNA-ribosyltransferase